MNAAQRAGSVRGQARRGAHIQPLDDATAEALADTWCDRLAGKVINHHTLVLAEWFPEDEACAAASAVDKVDSCGRFIPPSLPWQEVRTLINTPTVESHIERIKGQLGEECASAFEVYFTVLAPILNGDFMADVLNEQCTLLCYSEQREERLAKADALFHWIREREGDLAVEAAILEGLRTGNAPSKKALDLIRAENATRPALRHDRYQCPSRERGPRGNTPSLSQLMCGIRLLYEKPRSTHVKAAASHSFEEFVRSSHWVQAPVPVILSLIHI